MKIGESSMVVSIEKNFSLYILALHSHCHHMDYAPVAYHAQKMFQIFFNLIIIINYKNLKYYTRLYKVGKQFQILHMGVDIKLVYIYIYILRVCTVVITFSQFY